MKKINKTHILTLISLLLVTPIGFYSKFYKGSFEFWVNNSLCDVFYEIFWCLIVFLFFQKIKTKMIALLIFLVTCLIEFSQLWHPPFLELIRVTFIGRTILGTSFVWADFLYYLIGCFLALLWMNLIKKMSKS